MKKAFTLIELLVVIAIIAILAAILFPVFAQAKMSAKKTATLSNYKQVGVAAQIYLSDHDDTYPLQAGLWNNRWTYDHFNNVPATWNGNLAPDQRSAYSNFWANAVQPYMKSVQILDAPGTQPFEQVQAAWTPAFGVDYTNIVGQRTPISVSFNGLLNSYSATAIASPSNLPVFSNYYGNESRLGIASANPSLRCDQPGPCVYIPASTTCRSTAGSLNGSVSKPWGHNRAATSRTRPLNGMVYSHADTSAKFKRVGPEGAGLTDPRRDPFAFYDQRGATNNYWYDSGLCHNVLYRPDFEFDNFEGLRIANY